LALAILLAALSAGALAENGSPSLSPIGPREVYIGETLSFTLSAHDPNNDRLFFSGKDLPVNSFLNPKTGLFSWTPDLDQVGVYSLTFTVFDEGDPSLADSETIRVRVIYRLVRLQKAWGFGVEAEETIMETDSLADLYPRISKIEVNGQPAALSQSVIYTSDQPVIRVEASSPYDIDREKIAVFLDGEKIETSPYSNVQTLGEQRNVLSLAFEVSLPQLSKGKHRLTFTLGNDLGLATQSITLATGGLRVTDTPLAFPSPFNPSSGGEVILQYSLSQDADIDIFVVSSSAQIIKRFSLSSGQEGGQAGLNKVPWDGRSALGGIAANGIYLASIIDKREHKTLGKIKLVVY
jgi:hypothetical protein